MIKNIWYFFGFLLFFSSGSLCSEINLFNDETEHFKFSFQEFPYNRNVIIWYARKPITSFLSSSSSSTPPPEDNPLMKPALSEENRLAFSTVQIELRKNITDEEPYQKGTGFFVAVDKKDVGYSYNRYWETTKSPLLLTCGHCIKEDAIISFKIKYIDPKKQKFYLLDILFKDKNSIERWTIHPDKDMAYYNLNTILDQGKSIIDKFLQSDVYPYVRAIDYDTDYEGHFFPRNEKAIDYLSGLVMFGYPYELSARYSMPLARFGYCATDPKIVGTNVDFYADMANISGSSGSPLWFYRKKLRVFCNPDSESALKESYVEEILEYKFAGMLYAGPENPEDQVQDVHLVMAYNAERILAFLANDPNFFELKYGKEA